MKRILMVALVMASFPALASDKKAATAGASMPLTNEADKAAYSIGFLSGKANQQNIQDLNVEAYVVGFRDAFANKEPRLTEEQMRTTLDAFKQRLMGEAMERAAKIANANKAAAAAYLAQNAKKSGVVTTPSGLQYEVIVPGTGTKPKPSDKIRAHYHGTMIDGTVFDSSVQRGEPAEFLLDQVIPGWTEGLQLMGAGAKYRLTLPPELAYGEAGAGPIEPNTVLIFEVELLSVEKPASAKSVDKPADKPKKK
ncbi:MAG: FKBP-type peptidyl-prolyl cis-trans isomerase [Moraxellaceae bacterium]|nr:FKBP-type peptidyl-prolyl cis-trans isomerase [Moraxellaceae bacterium]